MQHKGRGAQHNPANPFLRQEQGRWHEEGLDEAEAAQVRTSYFTDTAKTIINKVDSPDLGMMFSVNPYQGCEHGCAYCYARNAHTYWGYSAGLDFESKIIIKRNAPALLEKAFLSPGWEPTPISLSGNTDCYQPIERKMQLTRKLLEVCLRYGNPVGIITKNSLLLRDLDILKALAAEKLVHVYISLTSLDEELRRKLEPRTATAAQRLQAIKTLSDAGIPCGVMTAPIIPGLNQHEIPELIRQAAECGACLAAYTVVRLNGQVKEVFRSWLEQAYPDRFNKVWHGIESLHGGQVSDSTWRRRMRGEGAEAESIRQLHALACKKYLQGRSMPPYNLGVFRRAGQGSLF
jgi:DNA repair photolyase